jgi:arsenite methyltransferase
MPGSPLSLTPEDLRDAVRNRYTQLAQQPDAEQLLPLGREFALRVGYDESSLRAIPDDVVTRFTGAGCAQQFLLYQGDESILDIGCGAGLDLLLTAQHLTTGTITGIDSSQPMCSYATQGINALTLTQAAVRCCSVEDMPFDDATFDAAQANGIFNLSPDKDTIAQSVSRVLKAGGHFTFAEIVITEPIETVRESLDDWFRCIGGAETADALCQRLCDNGFSDAQILDLSRNARTGHEASRCAIIQATK